MQMLGPQVGGERKLLLGASFVSPYRPSVRSSVSRTVRSVSRSPYTRSRSSSSTEAENLNINEKSYPSDFFRFSTSESNRRARTQTHTMKVPPLGR